MVLVAAAVDMYSEVQTEARILEVQAEAEVVLPRTIWRGYEAE
jgi:hypothetical protein